MPLKMDQAIEPATPAQTPVQRKSTKARKKAEGGGSNGSRFPATPELAQDVVDKPFTTLLQANEAQRKAKPDQDSLTNKSYASNGMNYLGFHPRLIATELADAIERFKHDPARLFKETWPDDIQLAWTNKVADEASQSLLQNPSRYWLAIASGKGVGKTYLMAKFFIWHVTMHPDSQTCLTATTGRQTDTRVWKEVKKLLRKSWLSEYFKVDNTKLVHKMIDTWSGFTQAWNPERPESFQGLHAEYLCILVDEASGVPDEILETIETGATDTHVFIGYFSNPTKPDGRYKECFPGGRYHEGWKTYNIDARDVPIVSRQSIAKRLKDAQGDEDNDGFRINVRGEFPKLLGEYFISEAMIKAAQERQHEAEHLNLYTPDNIHPYVMGCDISGGGMSASVAIIRQGPRLVEKHVYHGIDEVAFTGFIASIIGKYEKEGKKLHVFIEAVSYGRACVSLLKEQGFKRITPVNPGTPYPPLAEFFNLRAEMAHNEREWIIKDACLTKEEKWENLYAQLTKVKAGYDSYGRLKMEDKQLMLTREGGLFDEADALATTFAQYVPMETRFQHNGPSTSMIPKGHPYGWMA